MPAKMRVYYDTEFLEDGKTIDLISIGMYREDGKEYYAVSSEFDTRAVAVNWWLMENVMTSIQHDQFVVAPFEGAPVIRDIFVTDPAVKTRAQIAADIQAFVSDIWPEFWAWYGAYDHVALCQLYGKMIDLPKKFPMFTADLKQMHKFLKSPAMPEQPAGKHNALADAKFNAVRYDYLRGLQDALPSSS